MAGPIGARTVWPKRTANHPHGIRRIIRAFLGTGGRTDEAAMLDLGRTLYSLGIAVVDADEWRHVSALANDVENGPRPNRCCWPSCSESTSESWPLCVGHTTEAHERAESDSQLGSEVSARIHARLVREAETRRKQAAVRQSRGARPGFVYYLQIGGRIKIGYAVDVKKRMAAYPPDAKLLAVHPGTPDLEKEMHKEFAHALAAGREWFSIDSKLTEHISTVVAQFGDPKDHAHHFRRKARDGHVRSAGSSWKRA